MITASQALAIIMLLQSFGVGQPILDNVYKALQPHTIAPAQIQAIPSVAPQDTNGIGPVLGSATPVAQPAPCSVSISAQNGNNPTLFANLYLVQFLFPAGATVSFGSGEAAQAIPQSAVALGNYGFQTRITASTTFTLNVSASGYANNSCSASV